MSVNWTKEQEQVIRHRGNHLLVSAAAGSGKTAVLVERIIQMLLDTENPTEIDRLLVMTFTNAAAAEMRERISAAISKKLEEQPDNGHLRRQSALVSTAQIMTIDSFCMDLIRTHFNLLDLDPSFRIGDEGELLLMQQEVMEGMLEEYYASGSPEYLRFVKTFAAGKSDDGIADYIMKIYHFAQSNPYPFKWMQDCEQELDNADPEQSLWMQFLIRDLRYRLDELVDQLKEAREVCQGDEYLLAYEPMLTNDIQQIQKISREEAFSGLCDRLSEISWMRLATIRSKEVDAERKAYVTGIRDRVKKQITSMVDAYAYASTEEMFKDVKNADAPLHMLLELARSFQNRYQEKKKERNLVDFNDLEHEALKFLIRQDEAGLPVMDQGHYVYTDTADELSKLYDEILVDEYQDSNLVQEALIQALSGERFGRKNVFMVGDVKQSIYRFRLARPELFLEKYHGYQKYADSENGKTGIAAGTEENAGTTGTIETKENTKITETTESGIMIELHQNFRSRKEVLNGINDVFYRIMTAQVGNISYTEETALHPGAVYPQYPTNAAGASEVVHSDTAIAGSPELLLVDTGTDALADLDEDAADYTAKEIEAKLIAKRIRAMTDPEKGMLVWDKKLGDGGAYRRAEYRDIVILVRSTKGWMENILAVLLSEDIPAYAESRTGYFNTPEVEIILSMLAVLDNPMQDVPLAAVLKSPIGGLTDEELAWVMAGYKNDPEKDQDRGLYAAINRILKKQEKTEPDAGGDPSDEEKSQEKEVLPDDRLAVIRQKLQCFDQILQQIRKESSYRSIHELIYRIYEVTGFDRYMAVMPAGQTRKANLDMLVEKASAYEATSYKGLYHFIRYIRNLKKYDTDFGEASVLGDGDNTVRIMSIHKSKGLEFPIVFLAGMGKKFNKMDLNSRILIDEEMGAGTDYFDTSLRLQASTLKKNAIRRKMELDNLGEELRILYVAMTRAKEHLIMTGTDRSLEKKLEQYQTGKISMENGYVPYTILTSAASYLDWLLMSLSAEGNSVRMKVIPVQDLIQEELEKQVARDQIRSLLDSYANDPDTAWDAEYQEMLQTHLTYQYPHQIDVSLHTKMSVSELKHRMQMVDEEETTYIYNQTIEADETIGSVQIRETDPDTETDKSKEIDQIIGTDRTGKSGIGMESEQDEGKRTERKIRRPDLPADGGVGAARGTAYHRAMELLPFDQIHSVEDVKKRLEEFVQKKWFTRENMEMIHPGTIWRFLESPLGRRMAAAQAEGRLHKEQQFVMGVPAKEMGNYDTEELVVVQGIIDAYFEEEGELVIVDYKTDKVYSEKILLEHYQTQLDYYGRALEQMTGMKVKEKMLYSLTMQREICV